MWEGIRGERRRRRRRKKEKVNSTYRNENSKKQRMTTSGKFKYPLSKELHHKKSHRFMPLTPL